MTSLGYIGAGGNVRVLPYDAEVEYLQSTGAQFIYTGTKFSNDIVISGETLRNNSNSVCGGASSTCMTNGVQFRWNDINDVSVSVSGGVRYSFAWGPEIYFNGEYKGQRNTYNIASYPLYLFSRGYNNDVYKGRIYWFKVEQGGVLVRDFIPVRFTNEFGQTEGAMYDKVSGTLFRNAGTGAFLYGNDL